MYHGTTARYATGGPAPVASDRQPDLRLHMHAALCVCKGHGASRAPAPAAGSPWQARFEAMLPYLGRAVAPALTFLADVGIFWCFNTGLGALCHAVVCHRQ
jgi:hypothetical protein